MPAPDDDNHHNGSYDLIESFVIVLTEGICVQGKAKTTRKFGAVKRMLNPKDIRL